MRKQIAVALVSGMACWPALAAAQAGCPPEVQTAKDLLKKVSAQATAARKPGTLAGARGQDVQAPRGQDVQAPRGQDVQAPRSQAATKGRATALASARQLVREAEAACKQADGPRAAAAATAKAATELLRYLE